MVEKGGRDRYNVSECGQQSLVQRVKYNTQKKAMVLKTVQMQTVRIQPDYTRNIGCFMVFNMLYASTLAQLFQNAGCYMLEGLHQHTTTINVKFAFGCFSDLVTITVIAYEASPT